MSWENATSESPSPDTANESWMLPASQSMPFEAWLFFERQIAGSASALSGARQLVIQRHESYQSQPLRTSHRPYRQQPAWADSRNLSRSLSYNMAALDAKQCGQAFLPLRAKRINSIDRQAVLSSSPIFDLEVALRDHYTSQWQAVSSVSCSAFIALALQARRLAITCTLDCYVQKPSSFWSSYVLMCIQLSTFKSNRSAVVILL